MSTTTLLVISLSHNLISGSDLGLMNLDRGHTIPRWALFLENVSGVNNFCRGILVAQPKERTSTLGLCEQTTPLSFQDVSTAAPSSWSSVTPESSQLMES